MDTSIPTTTKRLVLAVSGGIAAYKAPQLVRDLQAAGAEVRVVMTAAAAEFVTPMALQAVSGYPVHQALFDCAQERAMGHIELARWAEAVLVAPATAHTLARLAHGHADDLLTTVCLATQAPVWLAPAMNSVMWQHPLTQRNLTTLQQIGYHVLEPDSGVLACGEEGIGRMRDPVQLAAAVLGSSVAPQLASQRWVITAGPTQEAIDPVRYVTNRSSGKMGYAIAAAAAAAGAEAVLISGPTALATPPGVTRFDVTTAAEMLQVLQQQQGCDVVVGVAAVCDYRLKQPALHKIKKTSNNWHALAWEHTPDMLAETSRWNPRPFLVGFAAETEHVLVNAQEKMHSKKLDLMVANCVTQGQVFGSEFNQATLLTPSGQPQGLPHLSKVDLAQRIVTQVSTQLAAVKLKASRSV